MKRIIAFILVMTVAVTAAITAFDAYDADVTATSAKRTAADTTNILGDVDSDGAVTITDVVFLQYYLAGLSELSEYGKRRGDVDMNDAVEAIDLTIMQRYLANFDGVYYLEMNVDRARIVAQEPTDPPYTPTQVPTEAPKPTQAPNENNREAEIIRQIESFTRGNGVDISVFNGDVDMKKLKAAGFTFVIIRLGYGDNLTSQDDTMFETNVKKAEAAGLDWGAYIYSYALNVNQAKSEVNHTLRLLKGKKPTMPIAFDWEDDNYKQSHGMPSNANVLKIATTYMDGIRSAGYYPIIYTGYYWLKGAFNNKSFLTKNDIWLAQWSKTYDYQDYPIGMWQYGGETNYIDTPYISGLSGMFDKDYSYKNYPVIIKAYGYNNHTAILKSLASTGAAQDDGIIPESENLPPECNGVMGDSLRNQ